MTVTDDAAAAAATEPKPAAKVVSIGTEEVPYASIMYMLEHPLRRPRCLPEDFFEENPELRETSIAHNFRINSLVDVQEDILEQYRTTGKAVVKVEVFDNGLKRFSPPEKSTA